MNKHDYSITVYCDNKTKKFDLPPAEFEFMYSNGIIDLINNRNNLLIDEYESETISKNMAANILSIIVPYKKNIPIFYQAIRTLKNNGTSADLDF